MYEKIMVATDGSENAAEAVLHAAKLARLSGAKEVMVLHVCPACTPELDPDLKNREMANDIVRKAESILGKEGIFVQPVLEMDYPPEEIGEAIAAIAKRESVDLLVLGNRGLSEFKGILLGSVSHKVLQRAACPVLVIKGP